MTGCVVPIYGFGAIILNIICELFSSINSNYKVLFIFFSSIILLSMLEFLSGFILYKFMNLRLWDYSSYKYNYKGFICLDFSLVWGLLALIFYLFIYPSLNGIISFVISSKLCIFLLGIYIGIFLIDLCLSIDLVKKLKIYSNLVKEIVDIEKIKLEARVEVSRKKLLNAIYPYISINKYLKEKLKKLK